MARWKLWGRSKATQETVNQSEVKVMETPPTQQPQPVKQQEHHEETPVLEYNETLYSKGSLVKKPTSSQELQQETKYRTTWENPRTIEENVDRIGTRKEEGFSTHPEVSDQIEKKVDRLIAKKKGRR
jgi:hypothetical protein